MEENNEMVTQNTEYEPDVQNKEEEQTAGAEPTESMICEQTAGTESLESAVREQTAGTEPEENKVCEQTSGTGTLENAADPQAEDRDMRFGGQFPGWEPIGPNPYRYKQGYPAYGYGENMYGAYYGPHGPAMPPYMMNRPDQFGPVDRKPEKKKRELRKKHPVAFKIVDAFVFGLIAALVFIGCNYLYGYFFPKQQEDYSVVQIGKDKNTEPVEAVKTAESVETVITTTGDVSSIVAKVAPAIVQIDCMFNTNSYFGSYQTPGAGSGIVMRKTDKELLIATNNHVVEGAVSIKITFTDGTTAEAVIKGTDAVADLAVVSVDLSTLDKEFADSVTVAKLGNSDDVRVGQMAIAIGNAMGYGQSTTVGYISAKDREVTVDGTKMVLIQTDAAINPGNSGGALINVSGEVIGINSVKFAAAQIEGMGFAIPISRAQKILDELGNRESLSHEEKGYLGVHVQNVTAQISQAYNWPVGVYITEVDEGLAAEKAGVEIGDIVVKINGVTVTTTTDLKTAISSYRAGTAITLTVMRLVDDDFEEIEIEAVLGNEPDEDEEASPEPETGGEEAAEEEPAEEPDPEAPKASPKDGIPEIPTPNEENGQYNSGELPDYFDPFKDLEDFFSFGQW
ncbi:MAG: trypsin-like peptidase domain-containing protein [Lachnospiraceae bacterium]|nr:trypsin-like peptidase domain-containing protein [Lachnospiraceae bacterium]